MLSGHRGLDAPAKCRPLDYDFGSFRECAGVYQVVQLNPVCQHSIVLSFLGSLVFEFVFGPLVLFRCGFCCSKFDMSCAKQTTL